MDEKQLHQYTKERGCWDKEEEKQKNRNALRLALTKKMNTMMIGFIAEIERVFGELWGHGLLDKELQDDQLDERARWRICRNNILDFGNSKIRDMQQELEGFDVETRTKHFIFKGN